MTRQQHKQHMSSTTKPQSNRVFIWLLIGCIFAATLIFQIWTNVSQVATLNRDLAIVRVENEQAKTKQIQLQTYVDLLNDDDYVLKLARARGFYSLPNEIIFTIPEDNPLLSNELKRQEALKNQNSN